MKVWDGDQDITFQHNASFFLFTTLEASRHIAVPKGGVLPAQTPVLTGTPVAGMAYLDRPCHAGYFIFPDLSVRHEGRYRLSFNLFEETKMEADMDGEGEVANKDHPSAKLLLRSPSNPYQHVNFRLEVKSEPFSVYSAKKFPGLAESTGLSRMVAEQGCRVRIRRDVRIRVRKDNKPTNNDYNRDVSESQIERYGTPVSIDQVAGDQARSANLPTTTSNNHHQYPAIEAKASNEQQQYNKQAPYSQHTGSIISNYPSHPNLINQPQQYQPHVSSSYNGHLYHTYQPHSRKNSTSSSQDSHRQQQQQYFRNSTQPSHENSGYAVAVDSKYLSQAYHPTPAPPSATQNNTSVLPPLSTIQPLVAASPTTYDQPSVTYSPQVSTKTKRGYSSVFKGVSNTIAPVQYGARPETSGQELPMVEIEEHGMVSEDQLAHIKDLLEYRRADGSRKFMQVPTQSYSPQQ